MTRFASRREGLGPDVEPSADACCVRLAGHVRGTRPQRRRQPRRGQPLRAAAVALTVVAVLLGGCSSDSTPADTSAAPADTSAPADTAAPADSAAPAETGAPVDTTAPDDSAAPLDTGAPAPATTAAGANEAAPGIHAPDVPMLTTVGAGEGSLSLIAWAGYTEKDWVAPFEQASGCKVSVKVGNTSDEMIQLMKSGDYDGVSASGDATLRLIAAGDVAPVNTALVPNYADVFDGLKSKPWNSVDGQMYGIPHGRGANLLMYNTETVTPAPDSWGAVFDPASPYKGKVTAYDSPIYLADAALYLMATQPELGIKNPYALDDKQFAAAVALLKAQKAIIGEYWSDYTKEQAAFKSGSLVLGTTWQVIANAAKAEGTKVEVVLPKEGATGWSDTWMISSKAKHPNCMYLWMNHIISPEANAAVAEFFGEAPATKSACGKTKAANHCELFHAEDEGYYAKVWYWTTPTKVCLDGRGATCKDYTEWTRAWTDIRG